MNKTLFRVLVLISVGVIISSTWFFRHTMMDESMTEELQAPVQEESINIIPLSHHSFPSNRDRTVLDRPNIVYLLGDDLGFGDVEYNGGGAKTPNFNQMAKGPNSILFTRFYSGAPTCSPSRAMLLTGRNHNRYCIWHADLGQPCGDIECPSLMPLPTSELTIAEILKQEGYSTAIFGKWHLGDLQEIQGGNKKWPISHPGMHGFDDWLVTERDTYSVAPNCVCNERFSCTVDDRYYYHKTCRDYYYLNPQTGEIAAYNKFIRGDSSFLVDKFEQQLKKVLALDQPFFIMIWFHDVHQKYLALEPFYSMYRKKGYNLDQINYLGAVSQLDEAVGRVRKLLHKYKVSYNTLLWFSSDNGPQSRTPGSAGGLKGMKGSVSEGGIRVPAIIEWPQVIKSNQKTDMPVVSSDFLPTVCDILDVNLPTDRPIDGISILPFLLNKAHWRNKPIGFAFHVAKGNLNSSFSSAWSGERYKLLAKYDQGKMATTQLFDMKYDDSESSDLSHVYPQVVQNMKEELQDFISSFNHSAHQVDCIKVHDIRSTEVNTCHCSKHF